MSTLLRRLFRAPSVRVSRTHLEMHRMADSGSTVSIGCECALGRDHDYDEVRSGESHDRFSMFAGLSA